MFTPTPKPHFGGPFNAKPIIQIALRKLHVNGATKVKLYSYIRFTLKLYDYIGIGKYLGLCQNISARGRPGAQGLLCEFGTPYYLGIYWS